VITESENTIWRQQGQAALGKFEKVLKTGVVWYVTREDKQESDRHRPITLRVWWGNLSHPWMRQVPALFVHYVKWPHFHSPFHWKSGCGEFHKVSVSCCVDCQITGYALPFQHTLIGLSIFAILQKSPMATRKIMEISIFACSRLHLDELLRVLKTRDWKTRDGQKCMAGKCGIGKRGTKLQDWLLTRAWAPDRPDVKLKTTGEANMAPNPIIIRYHFGNFVH